MGLFSQPMMEDATLENPNEYLEAVLYEAVSRMPQSERRSFCESEEALALVEAGIFRKNTLVKLSKQDDLERRIGMASIQIAKEKNDSLYIKLMKNREKERELLASINKKYNNQASRVAVKGQKDWLKAATKIPEVVKRYTSLKPMPETKPSKPQN